MLVRELEMSTYEGNSKSYSITIKVCLWVVSDAIMGLEALEEHSIRIERGISDNSQILQTHWIAIVLS